MLGALDRPGRGGRRRRGAGGPLGGRRADAGRGGAGSVRIAEPVPFLAELAGVGIKAAVFEGGA